MVIATVPSARKNGTVNEVAAEQDPPAGTRRPPGVRSTDFAAVAARCEHLGLVAVGNVRTIFVAETLRWQKTRGMTDLSGYRRA